MKKEWKSPRVEILGVKTTQEDLECESNNEGEKFLWPHNHICPRCGYNFGHGLGSHYAWEHHVAVAKCGANEDRVQMPLS